MTIFYHNDFGDLRFGLNAESEEFVIGDVAPLGRYLQKIYVHRKALDQDIPNKEILLNHPLVVIVNKAQKQPIGGIGMVYREGT